MTWQQCDKKKNHQKSKKMISQEKLKILTPLQKLPKNVEDLGKLIVAKGFENLPKSNKLPNLVILVGSDIRATGILLVR